MVNAEETEVWTCSVCYTEHEYESDAKNCCKPDVIREQRWQCEKCNETYEDFDAAEECCVVTEQEVLEDNKSQTKLEKFK